MFGDTEAYLEKHRKAARTRPKTMQKLGTEFFQLKHTKPLFNSNKYSQCIISLTTMTAFYALLKI